MTPLISLTVDAKELDQKHERLHEILEEMGPVLVAFSGGAASALLLRVAHDALGERAAGAIAVSE
ncbi:MAG: ATP-dependent sacrificial sulfur transferase LarE, partial [Chloroflexota bacterium]